MRVSNRPGNWWNLHKKPSANCGAAFLCLNHGRLLSALSPPRRKDFWRLHLELGIKRKRREEKMAEVSFALLCPSRTAESHSQIVVSTLLFRNLIARGAGSLRPSSGCKCFGLCRLGQFLAFASLSEKRALSARRLFFVDGGSIN